MRGRFNPLLVVVLPVCALALVLGCSTETDPELHVDAFPVTGSVLVDGKPAEYVRIALIPTASKDGLPTATGMTDSDGEFQLKCSKSVTNDDKTTIKQFDGAEPGDYWVSISWLKPIKPNSSEPEFGDELLPEKYQNPSKSGLPELRILVKDTENTLPPFQLKRR